MTIDQLRRRLAAAHRRMGGKGRFSLTINEGDAPRCFVTHWLPPGPSGFGDCRTVGLGSVDDCLKSLDAYVAREARAAIAAAE